LHYLQIATGVVGFFVDGTIQKHKEAAEAEHEQHEGQAV
jgi:hypothetical protein